MEGCEATDYDIIWEMLLHWSRGDMKKNTSGDRQMRTELGCVQEIELIRLQYHSTVMGEENVVEGDSQVSDLENRGRKFSVLFTLLEI